MEKWISVYGNAMSIAENKPAMYAKDITLRYPIIMLVDGNKVKITLDNFTGNEPVTIDKVSIAKTENGLDFIEGTNCYLTFDGQNSVTLDPKASKQSDAIDYKVEKNEKLLVCMYLKDYTQLRSGVIAIGPHCKANYTLGDTTALANTLINETRDTEWFYFLSQVDVYSDTANKCYLCYGDSITAQHWPDYLNQLFLKDGSNNTAIRRAVSGARILRQYENLTYQSYGLKAANRAEHEMNGQSVDTVIILQGINDFIHPVGVEVNKFRPWSDLPTANELIDGLRYLVNCAKAKGYKAIVCTILPVEGWRTYEKFRDDLRNEVNNWIKTTAEIDGYIDLATALAKDDNPACLKPEYNSGDNLHPSAFGYTVIAQEVYKFLK